MCKGLFRVWTQLLNTSWVLEFLGLLTFSTWSLNSSPRRVPWQGEEQVMHLLKKTSLFQKQDHWLIFSVRKGGTVAELEVIYCLTTPDTNTHAKSTQILVLTCISSWGCWEFKLRSEVSKASPSKGNMIWTLNLYLPFRWGLQFPLK